MPIAVTDRITRGSNNTSPFAAIWEDDIKVSFVTVGSEADRDLIAEWKRIPYMTVKCTGSGKRYTLGADITIAGQVWTEETFLTDLEGVVYEDDIFDSEGYIKPDLIKNVYLNESFVVDSEAEMLALTTTTGNFIIRTDDGNIYVKLNNDDPSDIGDFSVITHSATVISVNGQTGIVEITLAGMLAISANLTTFNNAVTANSTVAGHTTAITNLTARVDNLEDLIGTGGGSFLASRANVTLANGITAIDWSVADIQVLTISEAKTITAINNPVLGGTLELIIDGTFSLDFDGGLSAYVEGTYNSGEINRIFIYCDNVTSPNFLIQYYNTLGSSELTDGDKGDITVASGGASWTIDNDVVTYAKMQNVSATNRLLGRVSSGAGNMEELTPTQVTAMLDNFTSSLDGLVPASGGGTTNFLRADGTWAAAGVSLINGNGTTFSTNKVNLGGTVSTDVELIPSTNGTRLFSIGTFTDTYFDLFEAYAEAFILEAVGNSGMSLIHRDGSTNLNDTIRLDISPAGVGVNATGVYESTFAGVQYSVDFSAMYTDRSLIDKGYANAAYWTLGGSSFVTDDVNITGSGFNFFASFEEYLLLGDTLLTVGGPSGTLNFTSSIVYLEAGGGLNISTNNGSGMSGFTIDAGQVNISATDGIYFDVGGVGDLEIMFIQEELGTPVAQLFYYPSTGRITYGGVESGGGGGLTDGDKGDITVGGSGASLTINPDVVTFEKMQNITTARILGRTTAATGDIEQLTGTQVTAMLDTFTSGLPGLAPASGGGTTNFLRADGTWADPTPTPTIQYNKSLENPVAGDKLLLYVHNAASTPIKVYVYVEGSGSPSVTWNINYAATADSGAPTKFWTTDKTTTSTSGATFTVFDNSAVGADNYVHLSITSISGTVVNKITVQVIANV